MCRSKPLATFCPPSLEHQAAILAGHPGAKSVGLRPASVVWLKGALRHSDESPPKTKTLRLIVARSYVKKTGGYLGPPGKNDYVWESYLRVAGLTCVERCLFYSFRSLDRLETSMLVSAVFKNDRP
jgi:hypothetical protein